MQGISGWRWLFIIEGLPAIVLSFVALLWLPDYPETAKFLTDEERACLRGRLDARAPTSSGKSWDWAALRKLLKDPTFHTFNVYWIGHGIGGFGIGYALPTVIYQLGFTTTAKSQLMNIVRLVPLYYSIFADTLASIRGYVSLSQRSGLLHTEEDHPSLDSSCWK